MKIAILGASGRVGRCLVHEIQESKQHELVACYVSPSSSVLGQPVPGADLCYQSMVEAASIPCDLLIDFSVPAVSEEYPRILAKTAALVVGTTGHSDEQLGYIVQAAADGPVMQAANFAESFEVFVNCCRMTAALFPECLPELEETYHSAKKPAASGSSLRLVREIQEARQQAGAPANQAIPLRINRRNTNRSEHIFLLTKEDEEYVLNFSVSGREAFARGALKAGEWVAGQGPGHYAAKDQFK